MSDFKVTKRKRKDIPYGSWVSEKGELLSVEAEGLDIRSAMKVKRFLNGTRTEKEEREIVYWVER